MLDHAEGSQFQLAETYGYRGDADAAFKWLEAATKHDPGLMWMRGDPLLKGIESDPRYAQFLRKINLAN